MTRLALAPMLSRTTEYALRAIVWLAHVPDMPQTTRQIAEGTQVPAGYLAKVMQQLAAAGLVHSQRGLGGGFVMARPPSAMTVLDVVNAVEPIPRIRTCPLGLESHRTKLCALHRTLDDALAMIERSFGSTTIADLTPDEAGMSPLCPPPRFTAPTKDRAALPPPPRAPRR